MVTLPNMEEGEAKHIEKEPEKQDPFNPLHITSSIPHISSSSATKKYYLSSPVDHYRSIKSVISSSTFRSASTEYKQLARSSNLSPAHSSSSTRRVATSIPGELEFRSLWEVDTAHNVEQESPPSSISSSLHMHELLSELASSISAMTTAFTQVQASFNTYDIIGHDSTSDVEKVMVVRELQRLLDLHIGLHSLVQKYDMKEGQCREKSENKCTICSGATMDENMKDVIEKKNAMLKSYECIITSFLDEIRRKEAVTHALRETLAKSLLRGEKLERRMKGQEIKPSTSPAST